MAIKRQEVYSPERLTAQDLEELKEQVQRELDRLSEVVTTLGELRLLPQAALPPRYSDGDLSYLRAAASPEAVAGLHQVRGGAWERLAEQGELDAHKNSGDHDGRYYIQAKVNERREIVAVPGWGLVSRTQLYKTLWFQVPMTVSQDITTALEKVQFTTDTSFNSTQFAPWFFPSYWYSVANHRFTAPVDGLYFFYAQVYRAAVSGSNVAVNIRFHINGNSNTNGPQGFGPGLADFVDGDNTYLHGRLDMMVYLDAGDYVEVFQDGSPVTLLGSTGVKASYFGGYLI